MPKAVLIIGEDPALIDFDAAGLPPGITADSIQRGLDAARDRLRAAGHITEIMLTGDEALVVDQARAVLAARAWDVIVIGAGLRTLPAMAKKFELLINVLHREAPGARLAFNSSPDDSDTAALRWL